MNEGRTRRRGWRMRPSFGRRPRLNGDRQRGWQRRRGRTLVHHTMLLKADMIGTGMANRRRMIVRHGRPRRRRELDKAQLSLLRRRRAYAGLQTGKQQQETRQAGDRAKAERRRIIRLW
jgi:hypothetical protein